MSEFEDFARSQGFSGDFQRGCNGQYKSDLLHFMEKAFIHQQSEINQLKTQLAVYKEDMQKDAEKIGELQGRIDVASGRMSGICRFINEDNPRDVDALSASIDTELSKIINTLQGEHDSFSDVRQKVEDRINNGARLTKHQIDL